ncbi:Hypothetical protein FKW44_006305, partial [Caligus rogercresseyi]
LTKQAFSGEAVCTGAAVGYIFLKAEHKFSHIAVDVSKAKECFECNQVIGHCTI